MKKVRTDRPVINNMRSEIVYTDVAVIGGGAAGLAAAVELGIKDPGLSVIVLEKNYEPGRKLRATGSGRCNITNTAAEGYDDILRFFGTLGLAVQVYENGLVYPYSGSAADVVSLLTDRAVHSGAELITGAEVNDIRIDEKSDHRFRVAYRSKGRGGMPEQMEVRSRYIILAVGGKSGPMYGTTGDGYKLAGMLGHSIITPVPALTPVDCLEWSSSGSCAVTLAGTRTRGAVTLFRNTNGRRERIHREEGEIQFTRTGLSGICIFNLTRYMRYNRRAGESIKDFVISADLYPDGSILDHLRGLRNGSFADERADTLLRSVLKENIAAYVLGSAEKAADEAASGGSSSTPLRNKRIMDLDGDDLEAVARAVHSLEFHPESLKGWKEAQITSGGVSLDEIDCSTGESKLAPGAYIIGEVADRDFPCGGFNLSNAWITAVRASDDISEALSARRSGPDQDSKSCTDTELVK